MNKQNILDELTDNQRLGKDIIDDPELEEALIEAGYKITKKGKLDQRSVKSRDLLANNKKKHIDKLVETRVKEIQDEYDTPENIIESLINDSQNIGREIVIQDMETEFQQELRELYKRMEELRAKMNVEVETKQPEIKTETEPPKEETPPKKEKTETPPKQETVEIPKKENPPPQTKTRQKKSSKASEIEALRKKLEELQAIDESDEEEEEPPQEKRKPRQTNKKDTPAILTIPKEPATKKSETTTTTKPSGKWSFNK